MEQQIRDIGGVLFHVIRDMIVFGATGFVIGLLLRKTVKEASERLIKTIEFFAEDTRNNIEKLVESMEGLADHTRKNSERLMESITEFIEHTGKSVADDVATRRTLASQQFPEKAKPQYSSRYPACLFVNIYATIRLSSKPSARFTSEGQWPWGLPKRVNICPSMPCSACCEPVLLTLPIIAWANLTFH